MIEAIRSFLDLNTDGTVSLFEIVAQLISLAAMSFTVFSVQMKKRGGILACQAIAGALWTVHFFLIGSPTGGALNIVAVIRNTLFMFRGKYRFAESRWLPILVGTGMIGAGLFGWEGPLSALPVIGMLCSTVCLYLISERKIRLLSIPTSVLWLIYDAISHSVGGVACESFTLVSIAVALYRFRQKEKAVSENEENIG